MRTTAYPLDGSAPMARWFEKLEVLDILAMIWDDTGLLVENREQTFGNKRETWQEFTDGFVTSLETWRCQIDPYARPSAQDVAAAATGIRLCNVHWLSDEEGLLTLRAEIDAALAARAAAAAMQVAA